MALKLKRIESLLIKEKSTSSIASILLEYSIVKQKFENTDNHSWYFKKGKASFREKLVALTKEYENIRTLFNANSIDFFIREININNAYLSGLNKNGMNAVTYMGFGLKRRQNELYKELIALKSTTKLLMPIAYYLQHSEEFLNIIDL